MLECKKYRIELYQCGNGNFHVFVQPVEYLGKDEFKAWVKFCKKNFMALVSQKPWRFEIVFGSEADALGFAKNLAQYFGELCFFNRVKGLLQIVTPKEGA